MPIIELNEHVFELAKYLVQTQAVPEEYKEDAIHIALSAVHGIDYLLTWNFKHINNASKREAIEQALLDKGYHPPIICSPEELEGK